MNSFEGTSRYPTRERAAKVGFMLFFTAFFVLFVIVSFLMALFAMSFSLMPFWTWAVGIGCFITVIIIVAEFYNYGEDHICTKPHMPPHLVTQLDE